MLTAPLQSNKSQIKSTEDVVVYPTFAHWDIDSQSWRVTVSGSIFRPGPDNLRRRMFQRILRRLLRATPAELQSELCQHRLGSFLVHTEKGKEVVVGLGQRHEVLESPSSRNGHFRGSVSLDASEARELQELGALDNGWLDVNIVPPHGDSRQFAGRVQLIGEEGISVISDIDDTIKESGVGHRRILLRNTFLRQFQAVSGMSDLYRRWEKSGAAFHYVSSSPWQLYICLARLIEEHDFPTGSFHLRSIRLRDPSVLRLFVARRHGKMSVIRSIIQSFPRRRFVLVGDSGERDPEIYGSIARRFEDQVACILIRRVEGRPVTSERIARAFRGLPPSKWQLFWDPSEVTTDMASPATFSNRSLGGQVHSDRRAIPR